jgi:thiamine biosynthesis lipoprotein
VQLSALGSSALLLVTDPTATGPAASVLRAELAAIDRACSRFRADSEVRALRRAGGREVRVSPLLGEVLSTGLRAAELTDGLVDPTVADAMCGMGYDRDFAELSGSVVDDAGAARPAPGWWRIAWDPGRRRVLVPLGMALDFGATAKALAADRIAARVSRLVGAGVLVSLGGDVAVAGAPPEGGWRVGVADDHRAAAREPDQVVAVEAGGLATSSTTVRAWRRGTGRCHHIVDPRTGENPEPVWRTVSVAARSCVDANTASTASVVLGREAPDWLACLGLPARLVHVDGREVRVAGWPPGRGRAEQEGR